MAAFVIRYKLSLYGDTKLGAYPKDSPVRKQEAHTWHTTSIYIGITMPRKNAIFTSPEKQHYKQISYETLAASWFTSDGWEVLLPIIDHGKKTDLVIADDLNYYRIQIKTLESSSEDILVDNKWGDVNIDFIIYFSRTSNWGYIMRPFTEDRKKLNSPGHIRFHQHHKNFLKAFDKI